MQVPYCSLTKCIKSVYTSWGTVINRRLGSLLHPFNGPLSGTTRVSRYQKGKTNLDFTGARDSEWQWHQLGHMQVCISLQTDNHASTTPLSFFIGRMPFQPPNQQHQSIEGKKHWRQVSLLIGSLLTDYKKLNTCRDGLLPWKYAWTVSENATASGMESAKPTVNGLGPRDVPNETDVPNGAEFRFVTLSVFSSLNGSGVCRPAGRAVAYYNITNWP